MKDYVPISFLNDFLFCPRSIYFHGLYSCFSSSVYKQSPQLKGEIAHESIENNTYSTSKDILQNFEVYSEKYKLFGKLDIYDVKKRKLIDRKREIKTIYDGYIFQLYAYYFCLLEMDFKVDNIILHDLVHNKNYQVTLPQKDKTMHEKFEKLVCDIQSYSLADKSYKPILNKCQNCIYSELCDESLC